MSEYENFNDPTIYKKYSDSDLSSGVILNNYLKLLNTYHLLFTKNIVTKSSYYKEFIYTQGMKCLNHIYILLLHYTNNISFTYYHCEKGIYYFTEFISQIENENSFLKLSSIDAIIFVYKKTIYNINKKMIDISKKESIDHVNKIIKLIIKINKYSYYDTLHMNYIRLLTSKKKISEIESSIEDYDCLNKFEEALKNDLW